MPALMDNVLTDTTAAMATVYRLLILQLNFAQLFTVLQEVTA